MEWMTSYFDMKMIFLILVSFYLLLSKITFIFQLYLYLF